MTTHNKIFVAVSAIALLSAATLAQAGTYSLAPAGQGPIDGAPQTASTLTRAAMNNEVSQARYAGLLVPAGEGAIGNRPATTSVVTRAEVKSETLQARAEGALVPAGEGPIDATVLARHGQAAGYPVATARTGRAVRAE